MFVDGCKLLHFNTPWIFGSTWLQNPKAHKNVVATPMIYEFSNWVLVCCDEFKIKLLYPPRGLVNKTLIIQVDEVEIFSQVDLSKWANNLVPILENVAQSLL